jgi:hypothetical protein
MYWFSFIKNSACKVTTFIPNRLFVEYHILYYMFHIPAKCYFSSVSANVCAMNDAITWLFGNNETEIFVSLHHK